MAVNPTLEAISQKIDTRLDALEALQTGTLSTLGNIALDVTVITGQLGVISTLLSERLPELSTLAQTIADHSSTLIDVTSQIRDALDLAGSNTSLNAQNGQIIQLAGIGACCDDTPLPTDIPPDLCAKSQSLIDVVFQALDTLGTNFTGPTLPTAQQVQDLFRFNQYGPFVPSFMTKAEAAELIQGIQERGFGTIGTLADLSGNSAAMTRIRNIINQAPNAEAAYNQLQAADFSSEGVLAPWSTFIRYGFTRTMFSDLYSSGGNITGDGYDNTICGEPDPNEPEWSSARNFLIDDEGPQSSSHSRILAPVAEGPPDGGRFGVRLTSADATFRGATVKKLPSLETFGSINSAGDEVWYILQEDDTGLIIEWTVMLEGETCIVEYLLVGYNPMEG